jgi:hypothetical protein
LPAPGGPTKSKCLPADSAARGWSMSEGVSVPLASDRSAAQIETVAVLARWSDGGVGSGDGGRFVLSVGLAHDVRFGVGLVLAQKAATQRREQLTTLGPFRAGERQRCSSGYSEAIVDRNEYDGYLSGWPEAVLVTSQPKLARPRRKDESCGGGVEPARGSEIIDGILAPMLESAAAPVPRPGKRATGSARPTSPSTSYAESQRRHPGSLIRSGASRCAHPQYRSARNSKPRCPTLASSRTDAGVLVECPR